jgi:3-oxoadipate enol-lactonase
MEAIINGAKLHYEAHGAGRTVLLVHGFPLSGEMWRACVEPMQDDYFLLIPDLRGMGQSEATEEATIGQHASDLLQLLDEVGRRSPVVLVGHSMGGYVAFEFYRRYPELVAGLVLVDTRAQADTEEGRKGRYDTAERVQREGSKAVADSMSQKLFAPSASQEMVDHWRTIMEQTTPQGIIAALHALAERPDSRSTLEIISRPTLIVVGEEDAITPPADSEAMAGAIAAADLEIVPGAGHMVPVEQPERFVAILEQFLDSFDDDDISGTWPG